MNRCTSLQPQRRSLAIPLFLFLIVVLVIVLVIEKTEDENEDENDVVPIFPPPSDRLSHPFSRGDIGGAAAPPCQPKRFIVVAFWHGVVHAWRASGNITQHSFMIAKYNRKSLIWGIPGILLQLVCLFMTNLIKGKNGGDIPPEVAALVILFALGSFIGSILLIVGLCYYAKGKGYTPVWGLLGLLSCIGLIILAVLPDKTKGQNGNAS